MKYTRKAILLYLIYYIRKPFQYMYACPRSAKFKIFSKKNQYIFRDNLCFVRACFRRYVPSL